jgi:glycosyl transferase, family 25
MPATGSSPTLEEPEATSPSVRVFVINMERSKNRLDFIRCRLDELGLKHERIEGTDGNKLTECDITDFKSLRPRDHKRTWGTGQIGCFMSHATAWGALANGKEEFGLVLEDDLHLSDHLAQFLGSTDWIPNDADIVRLETTGQWLKLGKTVSHVNDRAVRQVKSEAWGAGAYILRKSTAGSLIAVDPALHSPVDDFLFNKPASRIASDLNIYQVVPALCIQDKFELRDARVVGFGSEIEQGRINQRLRPLHAMRRSLTSTLRGKVQVQFR